MQEIGFMQGRLSPLIDGKIQAFPWPYWQEEFVLAAHHGFKVMEWTLDQDRLNENPLLTIAGQKEIQELSAHYGVQVASVTGDCFMQAPFYKAEGPARTRLIADLKRVIEGCASLGVSLVVIPLVDNGSLEHPGQEESLLAGLNEVEGMLRGGKVKLIFESDYGPQPLAVLLESLDSRYFGINYDIGNSAALGFDYREELAAYGGRILNVHVKDRILGGGTVPLGEGAADLPGVLKGLHDLGYRGNFILQTARAADGDHVGALNRYRRLVETCLRGS
jgi:hexulose-6-phosphate isomerase